MRYGDLPESRPDVINARGQRVSARQPFLYCARCHGQFSASKGDYFLCPPQAVIRHCGRPMKLVERVSTLREVKA